jgi:hypothetical protein
MVTTPATIRTEYPLPVYNYRVEIGGESIAFSEVSGLTFGYDEFTSFLLNQGNVFEKKIFENIY